MNAAQQKQIADEYRATHPSADEAEVRAYVLTARNARPSAKATKAATAKATARAASRREQTPKRTLPEAPKGWQPLDRSGNNTVALRYSRRSRATGHIINIWDSEHKDAEPGVKRTAGEGRFVVEDLHAEGGPKRQRAKTWAEAYAVSRIIDGQPAPASKYLAGAYREILPADRQPKTDTKAPVKEAVTKAA